MSAIHPVALQTRVPSRLLSHWPASAFPDPRDPGIAIHLSQAFGGIQGAIGDNCAQADVLLQLSYVLLNRLFKAGFISMITA
ncbi:hypothetical protein SAMN05421863_10911 [Nitrosomonas communis]|uniref:Uncharacterized protein n=2 Tax=Nitrosomonas communis TaxID=44574 RepID=A0A1I4VUT0_9PROT|nr:hypothetical protein SAMN05421863_10911 [Nitrosomonas communis]